MIPCRPAIEGESVYGMVGRVSLYGSSYNWLIIFISDKMYYENLECNSSASDIFL